MGEAVHNWKVGVCVQWCNLGPTLPFALARLVLLVPSILGEAVLDRRTTGGGGGGG